MTEDERPSSALVGERLGRGGGAAGWTSCTPSHGGVPSETPFRNDKQDSNALSIPWDQEELGNIMISKCLKGEGKSMRFR